MTHPYKFNGSDGWVGISHCCVFDDGNDNWYFASQGRFPANVGGNASSNSLMMGHVRSIRWTEDGWPVVMPERYGAVPQDKIEESELVGNWEHIDLSYSYGNQKTSTLMTLSANEHSITEGTWKGGEWSYDSENQILTVKPAGAVGEDVKLYLQREVDWEATPRKPTIVFAGYHQSGGTWRTDWGKKVQ